MYIELLDLGKGFISIMENKVSQTVRTAALVKQRGQNAELVQRSCENLKSESSILGEKEMIEVFSSRP